MRLFFVTPAYRRYDVSDVCFAHRAWCIDELRSRGVDAEQVVVAADDNLELARSYGFHTKERANDFLGARWNDGYEYAARQGADLVVPIGSDSWIHPMFFQQLPRRHQVVTSRLYAICDETGSRLARLEIPVAGGVGPNVVPVQAMARLNYRPVRERLQRGHDGSLMRGIQARKLTFVWSDVHPLQYFAFRIRGEQLNPYERLLKYCVREQLNPWGRLAKIHPPELVDRGRRIYEQALVAA